MKIDVPLNDCDLPRALKLAASFGTHDFGYVVTPNVDHLIRYSEDARFRDIYQTAHLILFDSRFLSRLIRLFSGVVLPTCPGSDLTAALFESVISADDAIVMIGGTTTQADVLRDRYHLSNLRHYCPSMGFIDDPAAAEACLDWIERASPFRFCFLAVGCPQQERVARFLLARGRARGLALCVGGSLNFLTGVERRAPRWMQRSGIEWAYRLMTNPARLGYRYLVRGPRILPLLSRLKFRLRTETAEVPPPQRSAVSEPAPPVSIPRPRLLRLFSTTVLDQIALSGANFLVGLLLIRHTSDGDYGMYVLVQSAIALLISAQMAWLSSPLAVIAPNKSSVVRRAMISALGASQRRFLLRVSLAGLLCPLGAYWLRLCSGLESLVIAFGVIACWTALKREYLRGVLLVCSRPQAMLTADLVTAGVLLMGMVLAVFGPAPAVLWAIAALVCSAVAGETMARRSLREELGGTLGNAASFWREMRPLALWATVGAMTYWIYNQSYNYFLATRIDLAAVADVNAARLLLMPTIVLTVGIKSLLVPVAATWLQETGLGRLVRRLLWFATGIAALDAMYCLFVWVFRDWLSNDVLHKTINHRDTLILLWGALSFIALYRDMLQTALFALRQFKTLAGITAVSAVVSLTIMWLGITSWGSTAALIGQVAGESVNLGGVLILLLLSSRKRLMHSMARDTSAGRNLSTGEEAQHAGGSIE